MDTVEECDVHKSGSVTDSIVAPLVDAPIAP